MSWLKKTNGWQRFWIVVTCIYAVLTLVILNVNIADFELSGSGKDLKDSYPLFYTINQQVKY